MTDSHRLEKRTGLGSHPTEEKNQPGWSFGEISNGKQRALFVQISWNPKS
jgi:hypothetical protein